MRRNSKEIDDKYIEAISKYHIEHGYYPTMREIGEKTGYSSVASVYARMKGLLAQGRIMTDKNGDLTAYRLVGCWKEGSGKYICSVCEHVEKEASKFCKYCGSSMTLEMKPCNECIYYKKTNCCCTPEQREQMIKTYNTDCFQTHKALFDMAEPKVLNKSNISDWVKEQRAIMGLTVNEMADYVGISPTAFNYIELGKRAPRMDTFLAIIDALGFKMEVVKNG